MKNCDALIIFFVLLISFTHSNAQSFVANGRVQDLWYNSISGVDIKFYSDSGMNNVVQSTITDQNGYYSSTLNQSSFPNGYIHSVMIDCNSDSIGQLVLLGPGIDSASADFVYCSNSICAGSLVINNYQHFSINVQVTDSIIENFSYQYNFGDGNIINSVNNSLNHTYSLAGAYNVCVSANSSSCNYSVCDSITILPAPDSILFYGTVQDSSGTNIPNSFVGVKNDTFGYALAYSYTDSNGYYSFYAAENSFSNGYALVMSSDCGSYLDSIVNYHTISPGIDSIESNFNNYCSSTTCTGNINTSTNGLKAHFNVTTSLQASFTYTWDFGDGSPQIIGSQIQDHFYPSAGSYNACVSANSTLCNLSLCDSVTVIDPIYFAGTILDSAGFPVANNYVLISDTSAVSGKAYTYTDSAGNYLAFAEANEFSGNLATITTYCPGFSDSLSVIKSLVPAGDTVFSNFTLCNNQGCSGQFTYSKNNLTVSFNVIDSIPGSYSYFWDFGDTNTTTTSSPNVIHNYSTTGNFNVCITATSANCTYNYCELITITNNNSFQIYGLASDNFSSPISNLLVQLISDSTTGNEISRDTTDGSGIYNLFALPSVFTNNYVLVRFTDCTGDSIQYVLSVPLGGDSIEQNIAYCSSQSCTGTIGQTINGNSGTFTVQDTYAPGQLQYSWNIDGTILNGETVNYNFQGPGSYTICLTASSFFCNYSVCDTAIVTNTLFDSLTVYGRITDINGNGLANQNVVISYDSSLFNVNPLVTTNSQGYYSFHNIKSFYPNNYVTIKFYDCTGDSILFVKPFSPSTDSIEQNFVYCQNSTCSGSIIQTINGNLGIFQAQDTFTQSVQYSWDINGQTLTGDSVSYIFNSPGNYIICLTATAPLCNYFVCDTAIITVPVNDSISVKGRVTDTNGNGLGNQAVIFSSPQPNNSNPITFTNNQGYYLFYALKSWITYDTFYVKFYDCNGDSVAFLQTLPLPGDSLEQNFINCNNTCTVSFSNNIQGDTAIFYSSVNPSPGSGSVFTWDFGDSAISNQTNPVHIYSNPGTYNVCLSVSGPTCNQTFCDTIVIVDDSCALEIYTQAYDATVLFTGISNYNSPGVQYQLDFGDGSFFNGLNAIHSYSDSGLYTYCLTATDTNINLNCSICDDIYISVNNSQNSISGNVLINSSTRSGDLVILYEETNSSTAPFIVAIDSTITSNGNYTFYSLTNGSYQVKVQPTNPSRNVGLIPKYWNNDPYWADGTSLVYTSPFSQIDFNLQTSNSFYSGPGKLTVVVLDSTNQNLANAKLWLEDLNQNIIYYDITNGVNNVVFNSIPIGDYNLAIDYPGYLMSKQSVNVSASDTNQIINLRVNNNWIVSRINEESHSEDIKVFPNPFKDHFNVEGQFDNPRIELYDINGKNIFIEYEFNSSLIEVKINDAIVIKGIYLLKVIDHSNIKTIKLMVN